VKQLFRNHINHRSAAPFAQSSSTGQLTPICQLTGTAGVRAWQTYPFSSYVAGFAFGIAVAMSCSERGGGRYKWPDELRSKPARSTQGSKDTRGKLSSYAVLGCASHRYGLK